MQRLTNKERALKYAESKGIQLTVDLGSDLAIEIWGADAHYSFYQDCHIEINYIGDEISGVKPLTEAALWKLSLDRMKTMSECDETCTCYQE